MKSIQVLAHPRSGHHAFIDWLCSHQKDWMLHVNDPKINGPILRPTGGGHAYNGPERVGFNRTAYADPDCVVVNIERPDCRNHFVKGFDRLLFIRDFNTFLSSVVRLSIDLDEPKRPELSVPAWDWVADKCIASRSFVHFDSWASGVDYRRSVAASIGFETDGQPWSRASPFGGKEGRPGSSYDSMDMDGKAHKMNVTRRDESNSAIFKRYATQERIEKNKQIQWLAQQPLSTLRLG